MATTTLELPSAQLPDAPAHDPHPAVEKPWRPRINPWIVAMTVTLATFMEVLDSSIANVALPHIAGGLAVSYDESTWVLTSYLVSNAVVRGRYLLRACVVNFHTSLEDIEAVPRIVVRLGRTVDEQSRGNLVI